MDFGKIWKGSMIPVIAMLAITVVSMLIGQVEGLAILGILFLLAGWIVNLWLGFNGVKQFKFDYMDAAAGGAMLGIINGVVSLVLGMVFVSMNLTAATAELANSPYGASTGAMVGGLAFVGYLVFLVIGTIVSIVLAVIGAAGANYIK